MSEANFDRLAWVYDFLATLVFLGAIKRSQHSIIQRSLPEKGKVLVLGGGTGWILKEIERKSPNLEVHYVELSVKMIQKAQRRKVTNEVKFIHGDHRFASTDQYDAICTFFFLDVFRRDQLAEVLEITLPRLKSEGRWLLVDFDVNSASSGWRKSLVRVMHWFFGWAVNLPAQELCEFTTYFPEGFRWTRKQYFFRKMICATAGSTN